MIFKPCTGERDPQAGLQVYKFTGGRIRINQYSLAMAEEAGIEARKRLIAGSCLAQASILKSEVSQGTTALQLTVHNPSS